jgi:hypothetical protein
MTVARTPTEVHGQVRHGSPKTHRVRHAVVPPHLRSTVESLQDGKGMDGHLFLT